MARFIVLVIGIMILCGDGWWCHKTSSFVAGAVHATGHVIGFSQSYSKSHNRHQDGTHVSMGGISIGTGSDSRGTLMYYPMVEFIYNGQLVHFTDKLGSNHPSYNAGDPVDVLFQPQKPAEAVINSFLSLYLGQLILGLMGGFVVLLPLVKSRQSLQ